MPIQQLQQRLFTGALVSEEVNDQLVVFARRHMLSSCVWVPLRCFDSILKVYRVTVLPAASLIAVPLEGELTSGNVLVNAEQTSNAQFLETFDPRVTPPSPPPGSQGDALATFPVTTAGEPILHSATVKQLQRMQVECGYHSPCWTRTAPAGCTRAASNRNHGWFHAEEHPHSGRLNAVWCADYTPHTLTNQMFPQLLLPVMRERAVRYRYVSRLWMTAEEARRLFGASLLPDCATHDPPVWCTQYTGGLQEDGLLYYCADQFDLPSFVLPRGKEVNLAVSGVDIGRDKRRGFPLLAEDGDAFIGPQSGLETGVACADAEQGDIARPDTPRLSSSVTRQNRLALLRKTYAHVKVFDATWRVLTADFMSRLSRERLLRGWASPHFIRTSSILRYGLAIRDGGQQGVVVDATDSMLNDTISLHQECWMNASQLREPEVVHELATHHPVSAIWGHRLRGTIATLCARLQLIHSFRDNHWILDQAVQVIPRWRLRCGATGVPYLNYDDASPAEATNFPYPLIWYNLQEVEGVTEADLDLMTNYKPKYFSSGKPVLQIPLKVFFTLRAIQAGLKSPFWVELEPEECPPAPSSSRCGRKRTGPENAFELILPEGSTLVFYKGRVFKNHSEGGEGGDVSAAP